MQWPYPTENVQNWYEAFKAFVGAVDFSAYSHREDRQLILAGGGTVSWNATGSALSWSAPIRVVSMIAGFQIRAEAGSVTLDDGQLLYLNLTRYPTNNIVATPVVANQVPSTDTALLLVVRVGDKLYWRNGLVMPSGASVIDLGANQWVSGEYDWATNYSYTQQATPIEETMGYGVLDGSKLSERTPVFRATWNPQFGVAGSASVKLYDIGEADPPVYATPTLISTLTRSASGVWHNEDDTIVVGASPAAGQIANEPRMYELTVYQSSQANDTVYVGSAGISLR